jgi:signal transduction histidine kinase
MFKTLRSKILTSYLVIILLLGCLLAWSVISLIRIENRGRVALQDRLRVLTLLDSIDQGVSVLRANTYRLINSPAVPRNNEMFSRADARMNAYVEELRARAFQADSVLAGQYEINRLSYLSRVLINEFRGVIHLDPQRRITTAQRLEIFSTEIEPIVDSVRTSVRAVEHAYTISLDRAAAQVVDKATRVRNEVLVFGCLVVAACVYLSWKFSKNIVAPISELTEKSRLITAGELHQMVVPRTDDEIGRLGEQFNLMAEKLTEFEELNLKKILEEKAISESIVQAMDDALILIDRLGYILSVNRKAQELFGFRDVEGLRCTDVSKGVPVLETLCTAAINNTWDPELGLKVVEHSVHHEAVFLTRDIIPIQSGEWLGTVAYLLILRDVTRAYELEKMRSDFVGMVSHELRTPLTSIRMSVDLLAEPALGQLGDVQQQFVQAIREESERLLRIVNDLMDLAKIESGKFEVKLSDVHLQDFFDHLIVPFIAPAKETRIELRIELDTSLPIVKADPDRLKQVFVNLISNAMRYTPVNGSITFGARKSPKGNFAEFFVRDTGAGIPKEFLPRIFQRFTIDSKDAKAGTGLGLAISKEIVQAHGGSISVKSEINKGTEFVFSIPLALNMHVSEPTAARTV